MKTGQSNRVRIGRWGLIVKTARRLCGAVVRGQIEKHPWGDDWHNFWNLVLSLKRATAECPICGYCGPFLQHAGRPRQICVNCRSRARHRLIFLSLSKWLNGNTRDINHLLHIAPDHSIKKLLVSHCRSYISGDLYEPEVDVKMDLRAIPFVSGSIDIVFSSHVLEHIVEDERAIAEIYRVLSADGTAILIVPITSRITCDWGYADPDRNYHARECGLDYFDRYKLAGFTVVLENTDSFPGSERYSLASWEEGKRTRHWVAYCNKTPELSLE